MKNSFFATTGVEPLASGHVRNPSSEFSQLQNKRPATVRTSPESSNRIVALDGVRGLAIAAVFIHHAFHVKLLWMGVDLFFILSGFLITSILLKQTGKPFGAYLGHFYARRTRRIVPPYVVILLIGTLLFGTAWIHQWYFYLGGMNFLRPLQLSSLAILPLWSLAVEEQFYLVWPLAVYFMQRRSLLACCWILVGLAPLLRYACTPYLANHWGIFMLTPFRMDTLAAGALIAILWPSIQSKIAASPGLNWKIGAGCMVAIVLSIVALSWFHRFGIYTDANTPLSNMTLYETTLALCTGVFLLVLLGIGKQFLSSWPLVWLGRISYSIYLFHLIALRFLPGYGAVPAALLTVAYALAMWYSIEMPHSLLFSIARWRSPGPGHRVARANLPETSQVVR